MDRYWRRTGWLLLLWFVLGVVGLVAFIVPQLGQPRPPWGLARLLDDIFIGFCGGLVCWPLLFFIRWWRLRR